MEYVFGFGFLIMTALCVIAVNKLDDYRLENKVLRKENSWLWEKVSNPTNEANEYRAIANGDNDGA